jgi:hypothetical protein
MSPNEVSCGIHAGMGSCGPIEDSCYCAGSVCANPSEGVYTCIFPCTNDGQCHFVALGVQYAQCEHFSDGTGFCAPITTVDAGGGGGANTCVDIPVPTGTNLQVIATPGSAPIPSGGSIADGEYVATAIRVYGTSAAPGTVTGSFAGNMKIAGQTFESSFSSSAMQGTYYSRGTFTTTDGTMQVTNTCSTTGPSMVSLGYSVTGPMTIDVTLPGSGYTTVTTYTRQ